MYNQSKRWDWHLKKYETSSSAELNDMQQNKSKKNHRGDNQLHGGVHIQGDEHMHRFSKMQPPSVGCETRANPFWQRNGNVRIMKEMRLTDDLGHSNETQLQESSRSLK